jgi:hypothetical protein
VIDGLVTTSPARIERRLFGVQTIMVVSEDTSGNQSAPAFAVLDFGQPDAASAVWTRVFASELFPGTYTASSLSGGQWWPMDAISNVYALDNLYGEPDVYATLYQAMQWQTGLVLPPYAGTLALTSGAGQLADWWSTGSAATPSPTSTPAATCTPRPTCMERPASGRSGRVRCRSRARRPSSSASPSRRARSKGRSPRSRLSDHGGGAELQQRHRRRAGTRLRRPPARRRATGWGSAVGVRLARCGWQRRIAGRVLDYSPTLGPLVQFVDNTGTPVTAKGTVKVEGFSDE